MRTPPCTPFDGSYAAGADLSGTQYEQETPTAQDLAVSAAERGDRQVEPSLVRGHHIYSNAPWLFVSRCHHGLGDPQGFGLAAVQQHGRGFLRRSFEGGIGQIR